MSGQLGCKFTDLSRWQVRLASGSRAAQPDVRFARQGRSCIGTFGEYQHAEYHSLVSFVYERCPDDLIFGGLVDKC